MRIDGATRELIHGIMSRKGIFGVLVNNEPRMRRKGVPGPSEGKVLSEFSGTKVDEIESSWPGRISAANSSCGQLPKEV